MRVELPDGRSDEQRVVVHEGERTARSRSISRLRDPASPPTPPPPIPSLAPSPAPAAVFVLGGVGLLALGAFGAFAIGGRVQQSGLELELQAHGLVLLDADVDAMYRELRAIADISLGVGVAALAAAGIVWLARPRAPSASAVTIVPRRDGPAATFRLPQPARGRRPRDAENVGMRAVARSNVRIGGGEDGDAARAAVEAVRASLFARRPTAERRGPALLSSSRSRSGSTAIWSDVSIPVTRSAGLSAL